MRVEMNLMADEEYHGCIKYNIFSGVMAFISLVVLIILLVFIIKFIRAFGKRK
jgi:uncharacterized membrane protein